MNIKPIHDFLGGMSITPLRALDPCRNPYKACLFQPSGLVEVSAKRIGHKYPDDFLPQCREFLKEAVNSYADLVVTPEYSLPWKLLEEIVAADSTLLPRPQSIWVLGFESITPHDFLAYADLLRTNGHFVYHEPFEEHKVIEKTYVDPLVYVFWCDVSPIEKKLAFVIQFKTEACREKLDIEYSNLYTGTTVYSISNNDPYSISLLTFICSDSFVFKTITDHADKYLLIHIQLNPKPAHRPYAAYRDDLFAVDENSNVELLCLNWASDIEQVLGSGKHEPWTNNAGSAWFAPESKFSAAKEHLDEQYLKGLYYCIPKKLWHAFYLHSEPHVLLIKKEKVYFRVPNYLQVPKVWMQVLNRWIWDEKNSVFEKSIAPNSYFDIAVTHHSKLNDAIQGLFTRSPLDAERALELLCGPNPKTPARRWYEVNQLECLSMGEPESMFRATVHQDSDLNSTGSKFRKNRLQRCDDAVQLPSLIDWAHPLKDLAQGFIYDWDISLSFQNIEAKGSKKRATLLFLGDQANESDVASHYLWAKKEIHSTCTQINIFDQAEIQKHLDRLCIVYRKSHVLKSWVPPDNTYITKEDTSPIPSITGQI